MLEGFSLSIFSSLALWVKPGAYPRGRHLKLASLRMVLDLPANTRLGWKGLPGTHILQTFISYIQKCFITISLGPML